jgi:hypothetical protein
MTKIFSFSKIFAAGKLFGIFIGKIITPSLKNSIKILMLTLLAKKGKQLSKKLYQNKCLNANFFLNI